MSEVTELSQKAFDTLIAFLEEDGWNPDVDREDLACFMGYHGENGRYSCVARVDGALDHLIFRVAAPVHAPVASRAAVAEYLTRANFGLHLGNFEMDFEDGEVRFKTSVDFEGTGLTPALVRTLAYPAVEAMDRYLMGLMAVFSGAKRPAEAIAEIEGD